MAARRVVTVNGLSAPLGGDSIVALDGKRVRSSQQLVDTVALAKPGQTLTLKVVRGGASRTVKVTLGNVPTGS
jgi:serine protease Do